MKRFLLIFLALMTGAASAATGTAAITFTRPTTYTDGSALPASAITGYAVDCAFTLASGGTATPCTLAGAPFSGSTQQGTVTLTYPAIGGTACFSLRTLVGSVSSAPSSQACKQFGAVSPNPPGDVTVTVTLTLNLTSASPITVAKVGVPVVTVKPTP